MAGKDEVKLLGYWGSAYGRRVEMALKLKGIPYEYSEEDIVNKSPQVLELNPVHKKVPILIHNGKAVAESLVILEYIEDTWKHNPILPQDPHERAMARFWAKFIDEQILKAGAVYVVKEVNGKEAAIGVTQNLLMYLEKEITGKEFFGGKEVGFLDIVAYTKLPFCLMRLWEVVEADVIPQEKFPELHRWMRAMDETDVVKERAIPVEGLHERMKGVAEKIRVEY